MASIIDDLMARQGTLDPDLAGISWAAAADLEWFRDRGETEAGFLARVRTEARAAGFRVVRVGGAIEVADHA